MLISVLLVQFRFWLVNFCSNFLISVLLVQFLFCSISVLTSQFLFCWSNFGSDDGTGNCRFVIMEFERECSLAEISPHRNPKVRLFKLKLLSSPPLFLISSVLDLDKIRDPSMKCSILWVGYGMTELSPVSHVSPCDDNIKHGSIGLLLPNLECKVSLYIVRISDLLI